MDEYSKEKVSNPIDLQEMNEQEKMALALDFTTSSAISRVSPKILIIYLPIFWLSGMLTGAYCYEFFRLCPPITEDWMPWIFTLFFFPIALLSMLYIFVLSCFFFSKLFLIFINLLHTPREGVFIAEKGNKDFEFWCLRTEIRKLVLWLLRNSPLPWLDALALRWFGTKMDFSSHLQDSWCDVEFIKLGRKVMIGQGAVVMSSMIVGKYLIIRNVIIDDYTVVGGMACISPGTMMGKDSLLGAMSASAFGQFCESGWIYFGIPCIKLKQNRLAFVSEMSRHSVEDERKVYVEHDINIDDSKKDLIIKKNNE